MMSLGVFENVLNACSLGAMVPVVAMVMLAHGR